MGKVPVHITKALSAEKIIKNLELSKKEVEKIRKEIKNARGST
jgi:hypothetical protein